MKNLLLITIAISLSLLSFGQEISLWGMTSEGGLHNQGVIFEYNPISNIVLRKFEFDGELHGANPMGSLYQASNGKLYGVTSKGGIHDGGTIFEFSISDNSLTKLYDFTQYGAPQGSLVQAQNDKLYGVTVSGLFFEFNIETNTFTIKYGSTGSTSIYGSPILASNGNIYGLTLHGGIYDYGTLYEYNPNTDIFTVKVSMYLTEIGEPSTTLYGDLLEASNGKLYGFSGNIFEYDIQNDTCKAVHETVPGCAAYGGSLIEPNNGELIGMLNTYATIFKYNMSDSTLVSLSLQSIGGGSPHGSLLKASDGKIYGLTTTGGNDNLGIIFEYNPEDNTAIKKFDFYGGIGGKPFYTNLVEVTATSINYLSKSNHLEIYPNPVEDSFVIKGAKTNSKYQIIDIKGQIVKEGICLEQAINVSKLSQGTYILKVISDTSAETIKLIKE